MNKVLILKAKYITVNDILHKDVQHSFLNLFELDRKFLNKAVVGRVYTKIQLEDASGTCSKTVKCLIRNIEPSVCGKHAIIELHNIDVYGNSHPDRQYLNMVKDVLSTGTHSNNRTGISTTKKFGHMMKFDLREGFPLLTTKYVDIENVAKELVFLLRGDSNIAIMKDNGCNIWNGWATDAGELGPVYGVQWRAWEDTRSLNDIEGDSGEQYDFLSSQDYKFSNYNTNSLDKTSVTARKTFDQISQVLHSLKTNPNDRRMVVTGFNPGVTPVTSIPFMDMQDRFSYYIETEVYKLNNSQSWLKQRDINKQDPENTVPLDAKEFVMSMLLGETVAESQSEDWDPLDNWDHMEILLNAANAPTTKPFSPKENAAVGQQALPPCHMMFQLGTSPMSLDERKDLWIKKCKDSMLVDADWLQKFENVPYPTLEDMAATQAQHDMIAMFHSYDIETSNSLSFSEQGDALSSEGIPEHFLDMTMYQRSADIFLGVPYNIASYAMMLMVFAQTSNMEARNFIHMFGDYHIYDNHVEQLKTQMLQPIKKLPTMHIKDFENIDTLEYTDFVLSNYEHGPRLKGSVAI